jgi:hypothetical protein
MPPCSRLLTICVAWILVLAGASVRAQTPSDMRSAAPPTRSAVLHSVEISVAAGESTIMLEADGPLPLSKVGVLDSPPRLFIDLPGVRPKTSPAIDPGDALIRRVRIAVHSVRPLVTRVVIDLAQMLPFDLVVQPDRPDRLVLVLGAPMALPLPSPSNTAVSLGSDARDLAGVPAAVPNSTTGENSSGAAVPVDRASDIASRRPPQLRPGVVILGPEARGFSQPVVAPTGKFADIGADSRRSQTPPIASPSSPEVSRYLSNVSGVLGSLERLRPLLTSVDRMQMSSLQELGEALQVLLEVERSLSRIEPPGSIQSVHRLLVSVCGLAITAVRTRTGASTTDGETVRNAASAAAGALLLLDQARHQLGQPLAREHR